MPNDGHGVRPWLRQTHRIRPHTLNSMNESSIADNIHHFAIDDYTSLTLQKRHESMNDKSVPFRFFNPGTESRNTSRGAFTVFEPGSCGGFGECCRDLDSAVEIGGDDVFLFSGG